MVKWLPNPLSVSLGSSGLARDSRPQQKVRAFGGPRQAVPRLGAAATAGLLVVAWGTPSAEGLRGYYQGRAGADWRTVASVLDRVVGGEDRVVATVGAVYPLRHYWKHQVEDIASVGFPGPPRAGDKASAIR